jgi:dihydrofolate reductase
LNSIVAADRNFGIGKDGGMLFHIPADMKNFRRMTTGKVVVMGRRTLQSLPGGKPLRDRVNVVLSTDKGYEVEGTTVCHSIGELMELLKSHDTDDVFIIGGETVYQELIGYCRYAYITKIDSVMSADKYFPDIDAMDGWKQVKTLAEGAHDGINYAILFYENTAVKTF